MEKSSKVLVLCAVGLLGLISLGVGFAAEVTKVKASNIEADTVRVECDYPKNPATALGITAAVTLMMAQGILMAATGCFCCSRAGCSNCNMRVLCVISGLTFFIATGLLIAGAALNSGSGSGTTISGGYYYLQCYYAKPGVFAAGGVLAGISAFFGILYFLKMTNKNANKRSGSTNNNNIGQEGISVGQPQFPPNDAQDMVVVNV